MNDVLKPGNVVRCAFWCEGLAVRVTGIGDRVFVGYERNGDDEDLYERTWSIDPDPNKLMKKDKRKWVLA